MSAKIDWFKKEMAILLLESKQMSTELYELNEIFADTDFDWSFAFQTTNETENRNENV